MSAVSVIEKMIQSEVLFEEMLVLPVDGSSEEMFIEEEANLVRRLSERHKCILRKWNGFNLDVVRFYGCNVTHKEIKRLSSCQIGPLAEMEGVIVVGDDPAGFVYGEHENGKVLVEDTSSGEVKEVAKSLDDFFERLVFGVDAANFGGVDWANELRDAGVIS
jgi:hypothetical protein